MKPRFSGTDNCAPGQADLGRRLLFLSTAAVVTAALPAPAFADPNPPPNSMILSRDVPMRSAYRPGEPGDVSTVETAPVDIIFGGMSQMATILSDDQVSRVTAEPISRSMGAMDHALGTMTSILGTNNPSHVATANANGTAALGGGGGLSAIDTGMSALGSALGVLNGGGNGR